MQDQVLLKSLSKSPLPVFKAYSTCLSETLPSKRLFRETCRDSEACLSVCFSCRGQWLYNLSTKNFNLRMSVPSRNRPGGDHDRPRNRQHPYNNSSSKNDRMQSCTIPVTLFEREINVLSSRFDNARAHFWILSRQTEEIQSNCQNWTGLKNRNLDFNHFG